jgi:type IV secretion system protein VirD4
MPKFIPFSESQKQAAKQTDLAAFLQSRGEQVKKSGSEFEWVGHHVTLRGNQFYDQYQQKGGTAVDFVRKYFELSYPDAERFCNEKSAIFIIMPEENPNSFFMISLIIQQLYREILAVADGNGGKLSNRVMFYCDEFGTLPPIQSAEMMYSASRSRRLSIVSIIQSFQQLEKNYGREGAAVIVDNCQLTISGGFAPNSESANIISKALGSRTVMSGSVSRGKNDPSQSLQMIERPLMTADELKAMKKGRFVVMKTGCNPFVSKLKLFFKWGIAFDEKHPFALPDRGARTVAYVDKDTIEDEILKKFPPPASEKVEDDPQDSHRPYPKKPRSGGSSGEAMAPSPGRKKPAGQTIKT